MNQPFISPLGGQFGLKPTQFDAGFSMGHVTKSAFVPPETNAVNFKDLLVNTTDKVNQIVSAPDALMQQAMTTGNVDVHDVMIANAKADLVLNIATQVTTKVVQAYDRILQIQI